MTDSRVAIVHHHIFKNAGTSFNRALEGAFGDRFQEYDRPGAQLVTADHLSHYFKAEPTVVAVSGHHIALPTPQSAAVKLLSSVLLRRPLARVRSIYQFERRQTADTDGAVMAKKLDFRDFVTWRLENSPHVFCNYQTFYCARQNDNLSQRAITPDDLALAIQNLQTCSAVGTVERYATFLQITQYEASRYFPTVQFENVHLNATAKVAAKQPSVRERLVNDLGETLVAELEHRNQLDEQLYCFANSLMDRWLQTDVQVKASYFEQCGATAMQDRNWQRALSAYQGAMSLRPDWFKPYHGYAEACEKLGDSAAATTYYEQATALNPDFAWSYYRIGNLLLDQQLPSKALDYYQKALDRHPPEKSFWLHVGRGNALLQLEQVDAAIGAYQQAEKLDPNQIASKVGLSVGYHKQGETQQSVHYFNRVLDIANGESRAYIALGDAFATAQFVDRAIACFSEGLRVDPNSAACERRLAALDYTLASVVQ